MAPDAMNADTRAPWSAVGDFIRAQRELARLSLRQLADLSQVSNPYLSQIERGLYRPSAQVLKSIAEALSISAETLFAQAGLLDSEPGEERDAVEESIRLSRRLGDEQKGALLAVYHSFLAAGEASGPAAGGHGRAAPSEPADAVDRRPGRASPRARPAPARPIGGRGRRGGAAPEAQRDIRAS
jgi:transcriptional regulator with XRE-family HTH domain